MPITNITQTISTLPPAGRRGVDVQTVFVNKQEDFQDHLQGTTVAELNTLKTQINTTVIGMNIAVETINTKASEASASASSASTSANTVTTKASEASTSASNANVYSLKAGEWADNNYNVEVEAGKYSAKHWATAASNIISSTNLMHPVDTIADLRNETGKYKYVYVTGYHTKNDGAFGSHTFRLKGVKTTETDNGGTVIIATIGGVDYVYELQYDGAVNVKWFGGDYDSFFAMRGNLLLSGDHTISILNPINFLDCLDRLDVEDGSIISVNISSGEFVIPTKTVITGNLNGLTVNGASVITYAFSSLSVVSNGVGDHSVTITTTIPNTINVNDYVIVKNLVGTGVFNVLTGVWKVTGVVGNDVTLKNTCRTATIEEFTVSSGTLVLIPTVLKYDGIVGLECYSNGGIWKSLVFAGNGVGVNTRGVQVSSGGKIELGVSTATPTGIHGFSEHGIYVTNGSVCLCFDTFSCANGQTGLYLLQSADAIATRIVCNGNTTSGIVAAYSCSIAASLSKACGNGQNGIVCSNNASIAASNAFVLQNLTGVRVYTGAVVSASGATAGYNTSSHFRAESTGYIEATSTVILDPKTNDGDYYARDNGRINNNASPTYFKHGNGSGATASVTTPNIIMDSYTFGGISILTPESSYGYIYLGNPVNNAEAGLSYRGTSNELAFISNGAKRLAINSYNNIVPGVDNAQDLGSGTLQMRVVYAGTSIGTLTYKVPNGYFNNLFTDSGTVSVSDDRLKVYSDIPELEKQVAKELKQIIKRFKLKEAIEAKGSDNARIHYGTSAQEVIACFSKHGLDAMEYAMLCFDEWEDQFETRVIVEEVIDENGNIIQEEETETVLIKKAGNRYGIRYEELLCFIISAM